MILVLRLVVGVVTAGVAYVGLLFALFALGGTECDRGECNFVGEAAVDDVWRWVIGFGLITLALTAGYSAARAIPPRKS